MKLRAAIVGLGQAGSRFDEEPRGAVWSHAGAFLALSDDYELIAGADPDAENRRRFAARCPDASVFPDAESIRDLDVDVVSIATPPSVRLAIFKVILGGVRKPKVIVCEKPLSTDAATRKVLVEMCEAANVSLLVNYNRRYSKLYQQFSAALRNGAIGQVASITVRTPNRLWSVGSHALDLLLYLSGELPLEIATLPLPALAERGELAGDFICNFPSGSAGRMLTQGPSRVLIFEADAIGSTGRLTARNNGRQLELVPFVASKEYLGYLECGQPRLLYQTTPDESAFVEVIKEAANLAKNVGSGTCTGQTAMVSEELLDKVVRRVGGSTSDK